MECNVMECNGMVRYGMYVCNVCNVCMYACNVM